MNDKNGKQSSIFSSLAFFFELTRGLLVVISFYVFIERKKIMFTASMND